MLNGFPAIPFPDKPPRPLASQTACSSSFTQLAKGSPNPVSNFSKLKTNVYCMVMTRKTGKKEIQEEPPQDTQGHSTSQCISLSRLLVVLFHCRRHCEISCCPCRGRVLTPVYPSPRQVLGSLPRRPCRRRCPTSTFRLEAGVSVLLRVCAAALGGLKTL